MEKIDLHIHSNLSDGDDSIDELVSKIKDEKIDLFSITDHDNIKSIDILFTINDINYIPGVEMSSALENVKMHILGYGITSTGKIKQICDDIRRVRRGLTLEIISDLTKKGYYFPKEKLERFNNECEKFRTKWRKVLDAGDPYSNINFDKNTAQYNIRTDKI